MKFPSKVILFAKGFSEFSSCDPFGKVTLAMTLDIAELKRKYPQIKETRDWKFVEAINDLMESGKNAICQISYRPFDDRFSIMSGKTKGFVAYPRYEITKHLIKKTKNLALLTCKRQTSFEFQHIFISNKPSERCTVSLQTGELNYIFVLYLD